VSRSPSGGSRPDERFLVTGALGCLGAWTVRTLVRAGAPVVAFDRGGDPRRLAAIMSAEELASVAFATGDITDLASFELVLDDYGITNVIHLAALQVPFCRADPPLGALVNVVGTVNVFEAVKRRVERMAPLVYTGSVGMYAATDADLQSHRLEEAADAHPVNHYGVYKLANEGTARIYWAEGQVSSVGVRPLTVYGAGRDQGMTSGPTAAIAAAVLGTPYEIGFGGGTLFQYAKDVGETVVLASRSTLRGAHVFNLGGIAVAIAEWIEAIEAAVPGARGLISHAPTELPFPSEIAHERIDVLGDVPVTPLEEGIGATADIYRRLAREGRLVPAEHGIPTPG